MDLLLQWNPVCNAADLVVASGDLMLDATLQTAVVVSLATDRIANIDDDYPGAGLPTPDRRAWWGDLPIDPTAAPGTPDRIGSRLWLLKRAKVLPTLRQTAESMIREALQWMLDDGVAARIDVAVTIAGQPATMLQALISIYQSAAASALPVYSQLWQVTLGQGAL